MWRAGGVHSRFWRVGRCSHGRRHGPTALLALATVVAVRPTSSTAATTMMDAAAAAGDPVKKAYGVPFLPKDVYYDMPVKKALAELRDVNRQNITSIDPKLLEPLSTAGSESMATLTLIGYKGGSAASQINQDRAFCVSPFQISKNDKSKDSRLLMGVFDGHAPNGEMVSEYTVQELPILLANKLKDLPATSTQTDIQQILTDVFLYLDKTAPAHLSGGCTASVIYKDANQIYVANAGDSRSFLVVYRANRQSAQIFYTSREDKPNLPDERARVEEMGGEVYLPLNGTSRVLYTDRLSGTVSGLAMSRSIGDWEAGKVGVIPDPIVDVFDIGTVVQHQLSNDGDNDNNNNHDGDDDIHIFAVSATDGLMDYIEMELVARYVAASLYVEDGPHLLSALEQLIFIAAQGWERDKGGMYRDDIAISVASLRSPTK